MDIHLWVFRGLGHDGAVSWLKRKRTDRSTALDPKSRLAALVVAVDEAAVGGWETRERLVSVLADIDAVADDDLARAALTIVAQSPRVVIRLDGHTRRVAWRSPYYSPVLTGFATRLASGQAGPVAVAVASMHGDGRVRERAVAAMLERPAAQLVPFLALRTVDWVAPVRDRARAVLALLLAGDPDGCLPVALPTILAVQVRSRAGFARAQALAALLSTSVEVRRSLFATGDRRPRRFVFDIGLGHDWWTLADLIRVAESDGDVRIRVRAAQAACRQAVWTRRVDLLRRLAGSRRAEVRAYAVTGLVRAGLDDEAVAYLEDQSSLVRAIARDAARRRGVDALARHRIVVTDPAQASPGAIDGLAENGSAADAALLHPLLTHTSSKIRSHTVRALRQLGTVDVDAIVPLLRDPSPAVVREATAALLPQQRRLPPQLAWQLLADPRAEIRQAGYRLLRAQSTTTWLRAALTLVTDPDPRLARGGLADATRLARDTDRPMWRRTTTPEKAVTTTEHAELTTLINQTALTLGQDAARLLTDWLADTKTVQNDIQQR